MVIKIGAHLIYERGNSTGLGWLMIHVVNSHVPVPEMAGTAIDLAYRPDRESKRNAARWARLFSSVHDLRMDSNLRSSSSVNCKVLRFFWKGMPIKTYPTEMRPCLALRSDWQLEDVNLRWNACGKRVDH